MAESVTECRLSECVG